MPSIRVTAAARTTSPLAVRTRTLPAALRGPAAFEHIDLGAYRGSPIPMSVGAATAWLGVTRKRVRQMIEAGVLTVILDYGDRRGTWVLMDSADDVRTLYAKYEAALPMPRTHADFAAYRLARMACRVGATHPHPENSLEGAFRLLSQISLFSPPEVEGLLGPNRPILSQTLAWFRSRLADQCRRPGAVHGEASVTLEMFRLVLPDHFKGMPQTMLSAKRGHEFEAPGPHARRLVLRLGALRDLGALAALFLSPTSRKTAYVHRVLQTIATVEVAMTSLHPSGVWGAAEFNSAIAAYLTGRHETGDSDETRLTTLVQWRGIRRRLSRFAQRIDPHGRRGLMTLIPPPVTLPPRLRRELRRMRKDIVAARRAGRKNHSDELLLNLREVATCARNRRDLMRAMGTAYRATVDAMGEDEPCRAFPVEVSVLDERGFDTGGTQTVKFRVWRYEDAWRSVIDDLGPKAALHLTKRRTATRHEDRFIVEHLGTTSGGLPSPDPWMIRLAKLGVLMSPCLLPVDRQEARFAAIKADALPGPIYGHAGLLGFGRAHVGLARQALKVGRHFVPLEQSEHAIRLAFHALDCVDQTWRRLNEVQQQLELPWQEVDEDGPLRFDQLVVGKVAPKRPLAKATKVKLRVLSETVDEAMDLCDLHVRRSGFNEVPEVAPSPQLLWRCAPARYVLAHHGRSVTDSILNAMLDYLLAGWPPFAFHDWRHAEATDAENDGVSRKAIATGLGHEGRGEGATPIYLGLPPAKEAEATERDDERRARIQDERLAEENREDGHG